MTTCCQVAQSLYDRRGKTAQASAAAGSGHGPVGFAFGVSAGDVLALVLFGLAFGHAELELGPTVLEVQREGDEGEAILGQAGTDLLDLGPVEQQLAVPTGVDLDLGVGVAVRGDVQAEQPGFANAGAGERSRLHSFRQLRHRLR